MKGIPAGAPNEADRPRRRPPGLSDTPRYDEGGFDSVRVLITGANGFLGRHAIAEFLQRGHSVRALVRPAARLDDLDWPGRVEVVRADLRVTQDLTGLFGGVDILVHLAAAVTG